MKYEAPKRPDKTEKNWAKQRHFVWFCVSLSSFCEIARVPSEPPFMIGLRLHFSHQAGREKTQFPEHWNFFCNSFQPLEKRQKKFPKFGMMRGRVRFRSQGAGPGSKNTKAQK